ncbi:beta-ketoacyl-[acyl-carrier-protein] synthase family protein [Planctomycetaceae bacterium SH139]
MSISEPRRVVVTGMGLISPLGNTPTELLEAIRAGRSGIGPLHRVPVGALPVSHAAEATGFDGTIEQFGNLAKDVQRAIRKGQKLMCREIEMGVAAAQLALQDANLAADQRDRDRTGVIYGCDYIMTLPEEFSAGITRCLNADGSVDFSQWAALGLPQVTPLWLLKYLPNMPASHIAIYNDLRGPNNSLTLREASSGAAIAEAHSTIARGHADALVVGATGSRVMAFRALHASMQEPLAADRDDPATMSRPFAADRDGAVLGEGAAALIFESRDHAIARGANILAEVVGFGTSAVAASQPQHQRTAVANALRATLRGDNSKLSIGHINAHGIGSVDTDAEEAQAIAEVLGPAGQAPPVVAAKSYFGNLGAGGGMVEIISSLLSLQTGHLFNTLNCPSPARDCPIRIATSETPAGDSFLNINITPQGQASVVHIAKPELL